MKQLLLVALLLLGKFSFCQTPSDSSYGKPLIWYTVYDPWAMFIGAGGPIFTLYETGQLIFWKDKAYQAVQLTSDEKENLLTGLHLSDTFYRASKGIQATYATDQTTYILKTNFDTLKYFSVYGHMRDKEARKNIPQQLLDVYQYILAYENEHATPWVPDKIEVMLSDYSHALGTPLKWPKTWPNLESKETVWRQGGVISLYLDRQHLDELTRLLRRRKEKQAIEISGKKFYAQYRFPFPNLK